jgi:tRNA G37 N-methylase Trm5|tara:strand:- start:521 stop:1708 length:1188 start_codon:yes stop_codon:yes gene_type:complete
MMNVMRHLRVPNQSVQDVIVLLKDNDLLYYGMRIFPDSDGEHRLIPISDTAPTILPPYLREFDEIAHQGKTDERTNEGWWDYLSEMIGEDTVREHGESWPSNHEFIGDIMIVRINEEVSPYRQAIALSKMESHPKVRVVMEDRGVQGELRIRNLTPIAFRHNSEIFTGDFPPEMCNTRVFVRESGKSILCDPTKAYFSTKLQTERLETLELARQLRELVGRPIRVCDPFCGVGPVLANLISENGLISDVLATDLNPDAVEMLFDNLRRWDARTYPKEPIAIERIYSDRIIGIADASSLADIPEVRNSWDMVIVNLPHRTVEMLPKLIPLLDTSSPSMIRGRVVVAESDIEATNRRITDILPPLLIGRPPVRLKVKRDYSSTLRLCSFEAWLAPMP